MESDLNRSLELIKAKGTNPLRRAYLIQKLTTDSLNKKELAYLINKSPSYISNYLRLTGLSEVIKDAVLSGIISEGHARALTFLKAKEETIHLFEDIIRFGYSVRETEKRVDRLRQHKRHYGKVKEELRTQVDAVKQKWGIVAKIARRRQQLTLHFDFPLGVVGFRKLQTFLGRLNS